MILYAAIMLVSAFIGWLLTLYDNGKKNFPYGLIGGFLCVLIPMILLIIIPVEPTAMDVYEGKTTLEITYKDGVPIDSVVVFKDKKK